MSCWGCPVGLIARIGLSALAVFAIAGCGATPVVPAGPTPQQVENENLETSLDLVRTALEEMAAERDRLQEKYLTATSELAQRRGDVEFLEAQYRFGLQSRRDFELRVGELQRELELATLQQEQLESQVETLQSSTDRSKARFESLQAERFDLQKKVTAFEAERDTLLSQNEKLASANERLGSQLASLGNQTRGTQSSLQGALTSRDREIAQLRSENQALGEYKARAEQLENEVESLEEAKKQAVEARTALERKVLAPESSTVSIEALGSSAVTLAKNSLDRARAGVWDAENGTVAGILGALAFGFLFLVFSTWRSRVWKRRSRRLALELEAAETATAHASDQNARTPARRLSAPPELVRRAASPAQAESSPTLPVEVPEPTPTEPEPVTELVSQGGAGDGAEWNSAVTEDLEDLLRQSGFSASNSAVVRKKSRRPAEDEDQLLKDLREVIDNKFKK